VHLFKQPATADQLQASRTGLPPQQIDPAFTRSVVRLQHAIALQCRQVATFHRAVLTGPRLAALLSSIASSLNRAGCVHVSTAFSAMESEAIDRCATLLLAAFDLRIAAAEKALPLPCAKLDADLDAVGRVCFEEFDRELADCVLVEARSARRNELNRHVATATARVQKTNEERIAARMRDVVHAHVVVLKAAIESWCDAHFPLTDIAQLDTEFALQRRDAQAAIEKDLGALRADVLASSDYRIVIGDAHGSLKEVILMRDLLNEAICKERRIDELQSRLATSQSMPASKPPGTRISTNPKLSHLVCVACS